MNNIETRSMQIITGPCAAESRDQMITSAREAQVRGFETVRMSLWKPRTKPGFDGIGESGIPILLEVAQMGMIPATEVLFARHAEQVMNGVLAKDSNAQVLLWLGSRNQNDRIQKSVGMAIAGESRVKLMIKNQMWKDKEHWKGIVEHVLAGGASPDQLLLCHRGFQPSMDGQRNPPDLDLALTAQGELSRELGIEIPLIADPSHIAGGSPENVIDMALKLARHTTVVEGALRKIDGLMIEVHPNPKDAQTDKAQQLRWEDLDLLVGVLGEKESI